MRFLPMLVLIAAASVAHAEDHVEATNRTGDARVPLIAIGASLLGAGAAAIVAGAIVDVNDATTFCLRGCQDPNRTLPEATIAFGIVGAITGVTLLVTGLLIHPHHARPIAFARPGGLAISF